MYGLGRLRLSAGAALVLATSFVSAGHCQPYPNGPQFQVNVYWTGHQFDSDVAMGPDGRFVVTWSSEGSSGSDTSELSVQARRWSASGSSESDEFQVNTYTNNGQYYPTVALDGLGRFVIAWASQGSGGTDDSNSSIQARRYSSLGVPEGPEFQVNTYTYGIQFEPDIAADSTGGFVVTWQSRGSHGNDTADDSVQLRRFTNAGLPVGSDFQVNEYTPGYQGAPAIASTPDGRFVVAWFSTLSGETDSSETSVHARVFDASGNPLTSQFQVNVITTSYQHAPAVAIAPDGEFVVAWHSYESSGPDTSGWSIQARRYSATGTPLGSEFQVNTDTTGTQTSPTVSMNAEGGFVIAWHSDVAGTGDSDIRCRRFLPGGLADGPEFQMNSYTPGNQALPSLASRAVGDLVVAFTSFGSPETDAWGNSVHARVFNALFSDGFEEGNTLRWSSSMPREARSR